MNKGLAIFLGIMLLAGCSSQNADEAKPEKNDEPIVEQTEVETESSDAATDGENESEEAEETDEVVANNDDLKGFPEFEVLADKIDLDVYKGVIETDNKGNRIILFENEKGQKEYKSIFVKHDNRLKVIQLDDDGLIYNEIIK